jgi:hypothetical protein
MRTADDIKSYSKWKNKNSVTCEYFSLVYVPQTNDKASKDDYPLVRSVVEMVPKGGYLTDVSDYIFAINAYTYTG